MCWWCHDPSCANGRKCHYDEDTSPLLNSNTYQSAKRRIEDIAGPIRTYAPGMPWDGRRPSFVSDLWNAMMRGPDGEGDPICSQCGNPIPSGQRQLDHIIPWRPYIEQSAQAAMQEYGEDLTDIPIPDDFAKVMYSDPDNLQPTHAHCNQSKSDSMPDRPVGAVRRDNREAQRREAERQKEAERQRRLQQEAEREERADRRRRRWYDPDSDQDFGGAGIPV